MPSSDLRSVSGVGGYTIGLEESQIQHTFQNKLLEGTRNIRSFGLCLTSSMLKTLERLG